MRCRPGERVIEYRCTRCAISGYDVSKEAVLLERCRFCDTLYIVKVYTIKGETLVTADRVHE